MPHQILESIEDYFNSESSRFDTLQRQMEYKDSQMKQEKHTSVLYHQVGSGKRSATGRL
ncbi:hypothetical protein Bpfe_028780, partial [Biomphalaria pfeifferi]